MLVVTLRVPLWRGRLVVVVRQVFAGYVGCDTAGASLAWSVGGCGAYQIVPLWRGRLVIVVCAGLRWLGRL